MRRGSASAWIGFVAVGLTAVLFVAAQRERGGRDVPGAGAGEDAGTGAAAPADEYENIYARDYVGPEACGDCHAERYARWSQSLHRSMNRAAGERPEAVRGDFSGVELAYGPGRARFETTGGEYIMTFLREGEAERRFRVTRTIGSRYLQEYVGVQIEGPEPVGHPLYEREIRLPFGYWLRKEAWFPRPYFDSWYGEEYEQDGSLAVDPYQPDETPWAARCAWCHNTYPFELRALRSRGSAIGQGREQYVELIRSRRGSEAEARVARENLLPAEELVTIGISCESCHLGGREHAEELEEIRFAPASPDLERRAGAPSLAGGRESAVLLNTICAQCHSTPAPRYPDGGVTRNSSEALDMAAGACMSEIRCVDCHDPHTKGPPAGAPDRPAHIGACLGCHERLSSPAAARDHSRHPPGAASCLDCHLPKIVQGVTGFVRTHRISSPGAPEMLAAGAPNACNLCHLDRSISWTVRELEEGWGARAGMSLAWSASYGGDLGAPVGEVWLESGARAYRLVAAAAYGRSPLGARALPRLLEILDAPIAHDRMRLLFAVEDLLGRPLARREYDPLARPEIRARQVRRLRERFSR